MSRRRLRSIWLVARREIIERGRSRGYLLSMGFIVLLIGAGFILPNLLIGEPGATRIGVAQPAPPGLSSALVAVAAPYEIEVETVDYADRAAAAAAVEAEEVAVAVSMPADLSGPGEIIVRQALDPQLQAITTTAMVSLRQAVVLEAGNIPPAEFAAASAPPSVSVLEQPSEEDETAFILANIGVILMFIAIFSYGSWVLTGVVEEKQSRVVEVVLSTVRPRDLLMGKVLGIGLLGLAQLIAFVAVGLAIAMFTDRLTLPDTTLPAAIMLVFWFILGFALYATAMGFLGALATRMEEASNATIPVSMVATFSYIVGIIVVTEDPTGTVARIATFFPPSAPMVVPLRAALGAIEIWEIALAAAITIATIWVLFTVGGRIYSGAVLKVGGQVKLRDAWKASQD